MLKPRIDPKATPANVPALLRALFDPAAGDRYLLVCECPGADEQRDEKRRQLADLWRAHLQELGAELPAVAEVKAPGAIPAGIEGALASAGCALVLEEAHAPAAWQAAAERHPHLRIALLPGATRRMEESCWSPDAPAEAAARATRTHRQLSQAIGARIHFSTGQEVYFDLRFQEAGSRAATCRARDEHRLVTLPGGEAWTSTYDGDGEDPACDTIGIVPFYQNGLLYQFFIERGRITDILGDGPQVARYRKWFEEDPDRCRIRRLGFGCNPRASTSRNRVEARTAGFYWSIDPLPEPAQLTDPDPSSGMPPLDYLYGAHQAIVASEVVLVMNDGSEVRVVDGGRVV